SAELFCSASFAASVSTRVSIDAEAEAEVTNQQASPELIRPAREHLGSYRNALELGWSPDNVRGATAAQEQMSMIENDPSKFLQALDDPDAVGPPIPLPDGSVISRLPSITRWVWDGNFAGSINLRWQKDTSALPPNVLGHIGFTIVPWRRGRGYAKFALR